MPQTMATHPTFSSSFSLISSYVPTNGFGKQMALSRHSILHKRSPSCLAQVPRTESAGFAPACLCARPPRRAESQRKASHMVQTPICSYGHVQICILPLVQTLLSRTDGYSPSISFFHASDYLQDAVVVLQLSQNK